MAKRNIYEFSEKERLETLDKKNKIIARSLVKIGMLIWDFPKYNGINSLTDNEHNDILTNFYHQLSKLGKLEGSFMRNINEAMGYGIDVTRYNSLYYRFIDRLEEKTIPFKNVLYAQARKIKEEELMRGCYDGKSEKMCFNLKVSRTGTVIFTSRVY